MSETKFTPGPWKKQTPLFVVQGEEVTHTVEGPPSDFMFLQNEADAALIAAAPDLYAALETLIEKLCLDDDEGLIEYAEPMIAARAALAKARGEASK